MIEIKLQMNSIKIPFSSLRYKDRDYFDQRWLKNGNFIESNCKGDAPNSKNLETIIFGTNFLFGFLSRAHHNFCNFDVA